MLAASSPPPSDSSTRSRLSLLSSSSSLSSTFSDVSSIASAPSPPPSTSGSKTYAFFASPFSTRPPSPYKSSPSGTPQPPRILPAPQPFLSPGASVKRELHFLDIDSPSPLITDGNFWSEHSRYPSSSSSASSSSSPTSSSSSSSGGHVATNVTHDEPTPRPPSLQPSISLSHVAEHAVELDAELRLEAGFVISFHTTQSPAENNPSVLRLVRSLGQGAFSSVWLADDLSPLPLSIKSKKSLRDLKRVSSVGSSLSRRGSKSKRWGANRTSSTRGDNTDKDKTLDEGDLGHLGSSLSRAGSTSSRVSVSVSIGESLPPSFPEADSISMKKDSRRRSLGRLVAVKMTPRGGEDGESTRVGFGREVEVLRHISHPNITPLLTHLSTLTHHVLVLPYLPGGDLLGLVNADEAWGRLGESVLRRIWCELCKAVGWMHSVGLVHRDIKLENILLTTPAFTHLTSTSPRPTLDTLPAPPAPLIKLTDFGLSRFVDITGGGEGALLSTRCGSEAYAAPELVMGGGRGATAGGGVSGSGGRRGAVYDARETDAWACGVVLYALVGRRLPFGEGVGGGGRIAGERGRGGNGVGERRHWLMKIAKGEWEWPEADSGGESLLVARSQGSCEWKEGEGELVGQQLVGSEGAKRIVGKLLIRDPRKRARITDLWGDQWMKGVVGGTGADDGDEEEGVMEGVVTEEEEEEAEWGGGSGEGEDLFEDDEDEDEDGWLVDEDKIDIIAHQEVV